MLLIPGLGAAPLERAEVYFVDAARGMVESGDYLVPRYRGEPFFDKPALTYWLMAGSFRLFGFSALAARLVPAAAAALVLLATLWLGRMLLGAREALAGTLVLATTGAFMAFGRIAMSDMLLTLWSTLAVGLAVAACRDARADQAGGVARRRVGAWVAALGLALGLGFLTKGPVAVLLPGFGIALLWWRERRQAPAVPARALAAGAALFALAGLGWFVAVWQRLGWPPLVYFFLRENVERFAGETYDSGRAPWYYLLTYLGEGLPWSLFLPLAAWALLRRPPEGPARSGGLLLLGWAGLMAVPLSLSRGKIDYYLLPLYPALSLVVGAHLARRRWAPADRAWARAALALTALTLAALPSVAARVPAGWLPAPPVTLAVAGVAVGAALACGWAAWRPQQRTLPTLCAASASVFVALAALVVPAFAAAQPNRAVAADVRRERIYRPDAEVVACEDPARVERDLLFHGRVVVSRQCELWAWAASPQPLLLLVRSHEREALGGLEGVREVATYRYLPAVALTLRGLLGRPAADELTLLANFRTDDPVAETKRKRERKRALRAAAQAP